MADARKFVARAPRYTLQPADNRYIRFARHDESGKTETTIFVDISTTGLAFITDRENSPHLSDLIKVEVPLKDGQSVAWWARVVRIEEYDHKKWYMKRETFAGQNPVIVAVTFHELPVGHSEAIRRTVNQKFTELFKTQRRIKMNRYFFYLLEQFWKILFYVGLLAAAVAFLWYLALPDAHYDSKKGAPWGQRYPWLNFFDAPASTPEQVLPTKSPEQ
jgi:hypothetical protein